MASGSGTPVEWGKVLPLSLTVSTPYLCWVALIHVLKCPSPLLCIWLLPHSSEGLVGAGSEGECCSHLFRLISNSFDTQSVFSCPLLHLLSVLVDSERVEDMCNYFVLSGTFLPASTLPSDAHGVCKHSHTHTHT